MNKTKEEILKPYCHNYEYEGGGEYEDLVQGTDALRAMEEYSQQQLSKFKEKLKKEVFKRWKEIERGYKHDINVFSAFRKIQQTIDTIKP